MRYLLRSLPLLAVAILAAAILPALAQEKENPILTEVKASLKDTSKPFTLLILVNIKAGAGPKFEAAFAKARVQTRKEKGNQTYEMSRSAKTPTQYVVYERWADLAALEAHLKAPHIVRLLADIGELFEAAPAAKVLVPAGE